MRITCEIIKDILPLYYDNICSQDSRNLVDEHLAECTNCRKELELMNSDIKIKNDIEDIDTMKKISKRWKYDKLSAFLIGILCISIVASIGCGVAFQMIGSYVAPDGTLVEPFALIPLSFLSGFIALLCAVALGVLWIIRHKKNPK